MSAPTAGAAIDRLLRGSLDPLPDRWAAPAGTRLASVLVPLLAAADGDAVVFTRRRDHLPHHAGQVSFPGGGRDGDETPLACALRELDEELGVAAPAVTVLGALPPRPSSSRFLVQPLVARLAAAAVFTPQADEVAEVLRVPLAALRDRRRWSHRDVRVGERTLWRSPAIEHGEHLIWGLTALITLDLLARLDGQPPLRPSP